MITNTAQIKKYLSENFSEDDKLRIDIEGYLEITSDRDAEIPDICGDIENCDNIIDWIDAFYHYGFCEKCNPVYGCNYCPAYAWLENYGFHDKLCEEETFKEEHKSCTEICNNCIHQCIFESRLSNLFHYCELDIDSSELEYCEQREVFDKNQMTIFDLMEESE